jgi:hypothetical protein
MGVTSLTKEIVTMKTVIQTWGMMIAVALCSGCSGDLARGVYEGARVRNDAMKDAPGGAAKAPGSYDDYDAERQRVMKGRVN